MQPRLSLEREHAKAQLIEVFRAPAQAIVVHYALQQLRRDQTELAAPVAAIAVRNVGTGQGHVFSIKAEADSAGIDLSAQPSRMAMNQLEYSLLFKFNEYLAAHADCRFVHWYMRDDRFGFSALEHRFRKVLADFYQLQLGGRSVAAAAPFGFGGSPSPYPVRVPDGRKVDLAKIIRDLTATGPLSLREIADRNGLSHDELIPGAEEPGVFESGNHARLQWSTSTKARLICEILERLRDGTLVLTERAAPPQSTIGRIFINYRREDTEASAARINDKLTQAFGESSVFFDIDDIPAGVDFVEVLQKQIDTCDVFLAVIGRRWLGFTDQNGRPRLDDSNDFVRTEIRSALKRGIPVIPVLVDGAQMPRPGDLPADIDALRRRQAVEIRTQRQIEFNSDAEWLVLRIRETLRHARGELKMGR